MTLKQLEKKLSKAWCGETAYPNGCGDLFNPDNPSQNQCLVTSLVVQDYFGGDIVHGTVDDHSHFWNRIDGKDIDLTIQQFGEYKTKKFKRIRTRASCFKGVSTKDRYILLKSKL